MLFGLVVVVSILVLGHCQKMNSINIGFISALNMPNPNTQMAGHPAGLSFLLAINEINSRSDILSNHTLVPYWNSTDSELGKAVESTFYLIQERKVAAVIGEYNSDLTQQASLVCRMFNMPQLSYSSTSVVFEDKVNYPTFFRGTASIFTQTIVLVRVCKALNWMRVASIGSNSAFDADALVQGVTVLTSQVMITGSCVDLSYQMTQLVASKARIFALFTVVGDARCVVQWAWRYGLIGPGYFWLTTWSQMYTALYSNATNYVLPDTPATDTVPQIPALYHLFQNLLGMVPHVDKTRALFRHVYDLNINASLVPDFWTAHRQTPNIMTYLTYDAIYAMAYAWDAALRDGANIIAKPALVMPYLRRTNFTGVTGSGHSVLVVIDDRFGSYWFNSKQSRQLSYDIIQLQGSKFNLVGFADINQKISIDKSLITYFGTSFPVDRQPPTYVSAGSSILAAATAVSVFGCLMCLGLAVILQLNASETIVKSSSLLFNQIVLLGCFLIFLCIPIQAVDTGNTNATVSASSCIVYTFLLSTGFCLVFLSLAAKTWRVVQIFGNELIVLVSIPDAVLLQGVVGFTLIDLIINIVWAATDPLTQTMTAIDEFSQCERCLSTNFTPFLWASLGYKIGILVVTCVLCFMARNVPAQFNEGALIFFAAYQSVLILVIALPMSLLLAGVTFIQPIRTVALAVSALGIVLILFTPVFYTLYLESTGSTMKRSSNNNRTPDQHPSAMKRGSTASMNVAPNSPKTYEGVQSSPSSPPPRSMSGRTSLATGTRVRVGVNRNSHMEMDDELMTRAVAPSTVAASQAKTGAASEIDLAVV